MSNVSHASGYISGDDLTVISQRFFTVAHHRQSVIAIIILWEDGTDTLDIAREMGMREPTIDRVVSAYLNVKFMKNPRCGVAESTWAPEQISDLNAAGTKPVSNGPRQIIKRTAPRCRAEKTTVRTVAPIAPAIDLAIPEANPLRISLMDLTASTCHWPLGDPGKPGFAFCEAEKDACVPYCRFHCGLAYEKTKRPGKPFRLMQKPSARACYFREELEV